MAFKGFVCGGDAQDGAIEDNTCGRFHGSELRHAMPLCELERELLVLFRPPAICFLSFAMFFARLPGPPSLVFLPGRPVPGIWFFAHAPGPCFCETV